MFKGFSEQGAFFFFNFSGYTLCQFQGPRRTQFNMTLSKLTGNGCDMSPGGRKTREVPPKMSASTLEQKGF